MKYVVLFQRGDRTPKLNRDEMQAIRTKGHPAELHGMLDCQSLKEYISLKGQGRPGLSVGSPARLIRLTSRGRRIQHVCCDLISA